MSLWQHTEMYLTKKWVLYLSNVVEINGRLRNKDFVNLRKHSMILTRYNVNDNNPLMYLSSSFNEKRKSQNKFEKER